MEQILIEVFNSYTLYETFGIIAFTLLPVLLFSVYSYYFIKNNDLPMINLAAAMTYPIFFGLLGYISNELFHTVTNGMQQVGYAFGLFIVFGNLATLSSIYLQEIRGKGFDPDHITRKHFATSLNTGSIFIVLVTIMAAFGESWLRNVLFTMSLTVIVELVLIHLIARRYINETN